MSPLASAIAIQTPEEVERAMESVFARPEFETPSGSPLWRWVGEAWEAVWDFIRGLFPSLSLGTGSQTLLFWLVMGLLTLAAAFVAWRVALRIARSTRGGARGPRQRPGAPDRVTPSSSSDEWDARARELAAVGRWREAALALYQALLLRLAARGVLHVDAAKTPGDYRRESRSHSEAHRLLDDFLRGFEPVAFGGRYADADAYERLRDAAASGEDATRTARSGDSRG